MATIKIEIKTKNGEGKGILPLEWAEVKEIWAMIGFVGFHLKRESNSEGFIFLILQFTIYQILLAHTENNNHSNLQ